MSRGIRDGLGHASPVSGISLQLAPFARKVPVMGPTRAKAGGRGRVGSLGPVSRPPPAAHDRVADDASDRQPVALASLRLPRAQFASDRSRSVSLDAVPLSWCSVLRVGGIPEKAHASHAEGSIPEGIRRHLAAHDALGWAPACHLREKGLPPGFSELPPSLML